jgi:hypothetical protein
MAATGSDSRTVSGDAQKGKKMIADIQKLLIRAFTPCVFICGQHGRCRATM